MLKQKSGEKQERAGLTPHVNGCEVDGGLGGSPYLKICYEIT